MTPDDYQRQLDARARLSERIGMLEWAVEELLRIADRSDLNRFDAWAVGRAREILGPAN